MARNQESAAEPSNPAAPPTQRAYTLRLRGIDPQDNSWRDALWATHEAINKGAKAFGDWLLTLRGGLDHTLAEPPPPPKGKKRRQGDSAALRRTRHILLALSWLSVEDEHGAPTGDVRVATGRDAPSAREQKVLAALAGILKARGVNPAEIGDPGSKPEDQPGTWIGDCGASITAAIREDAVWVNRSALFDAADARIEGGLKREDVWEILDWVHKPSDTYFDIVPVAVEEDSESPAQGKQPRAKKPRAGTAQKAKDLAHDAGNWLVLRFPKAAGADFDSVSNQYKRLQRFLTSNARPGMSGESLLADLAHELGIGSAKADAIEKAFTYSGAKKRSAFFKTLPAVLGAPSVSVDQLESLRSAVAEAIRAFDKKIADWTRRPKGRRAWSDAVLTDVARASGIVYSPENGKKHHVEYCVMLDHAARRVSIGHSWIKRAEAERQRFTEDANRIDRVPAAARAWLDKLCSERSETSGAVGEYRIRRRAVEGWEEVLKRWASSDCKTAEDRIAAAREAQADPEIDKFGDIQLFEALASDDALCVWRNGNDVAPDRLKDYVFAHDARFQQRRFKVPAYRHPDALRHPVFCDFGDSRWDVDFALHRRSKLEAARGTVEKRENGVRKARASLDRSRTPEKKAKAEGKLREAEKRLAEAKRELAWLSDPRAMQMGLWNGVAVQPIDCLRWSSKRLTRDIGLKASNDKTLVARGDRLGRIAAGVDDAAIVVPAGLFEQDHWNARLQAPRSQLNDLAAYLDRNGGRWDDKAKRMRDRLAWLVTFSAKLECRGPWFLYYESVHDNSPFLKTVKSGARKGQIYASPDGWPHAIPNDKREGHAKLILSRLPGLRVLSVDLGHRFAAACAVWEALPKADFEQEIKGREIIAGGTGSEHLFCHTQHTDPAGKQRTTIYRRIGEDSLRDPKTGKPTTTPHPAPWARLDRQFLIKLQGEESPARKASPDEIETIRQMESDLGYVREAHNPLPAQIDELLSEAVRLVRLGLRRHGDAARIAYAFHPESARLTPGGGVEAHTPGTRWQAILDALIRWHGMATSERWNDPRAMEAWRVHIQPALATDLPALTPDADRWERRRFRTTLEDELTPAATALAPDDAAALYALWSKRWEADDAAWRPRLRQLRRMLLPRGLRPVDGDTDAEAAARRARRGAARHTGGLSLTRIATIRELYQVQKAYSMRLEPDNPRKNIPEKNDDRFAEFGRSILEAVDRMREQRVKQIASRIVEASLGVGIERDRVWDDEKKKWRYPKRPRSLLYNEDGEGNTHGDPRFKTCHAVVIENLRNYKFADTQPRRENRALMNWSAGKVRKYLEEACQLHGLHLREVMPNYTSRQCSRTGLPGLRCDDVPIDEFLTAPWWNKAVNAAEKRLLENGKDSLDWLLVALKKKWSGASDSDKRKQRTLRLPRAGGDLFITAPPNGAATAKSQRRRVLQADLNAAANIGLRALLDPDFPGRWWYVPCIEDKAAGTAVPRADKVKGSMCFGPDPSKPEQFGSLLKPSDGDSSDGQARSARRQGTRSSKSDGKETTNFWSDSRAAPLRNATNGGFWLPTPAYWRWVRKRVVAVLWQANGLPASPDELVMNNRP